ncbi:hypothetical protein [Flavobacterium sp. UBA7663]|uniref:hypothetical protein n=1 Tax=Flavobacterium sp. UBA7663 TaxID=1946557 RepID=UPI0025BAD1B8|nr:hypothetical protein [Flavobacterium sp. UBA7663]
MTVEKIGVAVIQSLSSDEKQTGKELFETTLKYISFSKNYLENDFFDVSNSEDFFKVFTELIKKAVTENKFYFLHFEIHGSEYGIELKNGDFITWKQLLEPLRELNILYKNQLSIYLAVCHGNTLLRSIEPLKRSPFAFIIGSFFEIYNSDILNGFEKFYSIFFENFKIEYALQEMKKTCKKSDFTIITSNYVIDTLLEMESKSNEKEKLIKMLNETFDQDSKIEKKLAEEIKEKIIQEFENHKIDKDYFLMNDLTNTYDNSGLGQLS